VSITIPDEVLASSGLTEDEMKWELAIALFQAERLTLAQAARLAGQAQLEFQKMLASRRIPIHYGIEELEEDLRTVRHVPAL
jgi:predicted HTH domain antitoxin